MSDILKNQSCRPSAVGCVGKTSVKVVNEAGKVVFLVSKNLGESGGNLQMFGNINECLEPEKVKKATRWIP